MFFQTTLCAQTSKMKTKRISDLRWWHSVLDIIQKIFTFRNWRALKPKCMMEAQMASRQNSFTIISCAKMSILNILNEFFFG